MPRNLESEQAILEAMPSLSREHQVSSPASSDEEDSQSPDPMSLYRYPTVPIEERFQKLKDLHPYGALLSQDDLDECDWLEHTAFKPHEAATREKLEYRLATCGELCSGLFSSAYATSPGKIGEVIRARRTFPSVDSSDSDRKRVLLGHIIATKHTSQLVTDPSMDYPKDWKSKFELNPSSGTGHHEDGQTVCLHSLGIHPYFQGKGLGQVLLKGWTARIREAGVAKRIALICREKYIPFYEKAGFKKIGESKCQYGGGGWYDMIMDLEHPDFDLEY